MKTSRQKNNIIISSYTQGGYALLFSVIVSSIILAIGVGISDITIKGLLLSATSRDSQFAFYAADSGTECVRYWDTQHEGFSDTVFATSTNSFTPTRGVICNDQNIAENWIVHKRAASATTIFTVNFSGDVCSVVRVTKSVRDPQTTIVARGYNTCIIDEPRRLERAMHTSY